MGRKVKYIFLSLFTAVTVLALSFSSASTVNAATSYSTPITVSPSSTSSANGVYHLELLSLANAIAYDDVEEGQTRSYLHSTLMFPIRIVADSVNSYTNIAFNVIFNTSYTPVSGFEFKSQSFSIECENNNVNFSVLPTSNSSQAQIYCYGHDLDLNHPKQIAFVLKIDTYWVAQDETSFTNTLGSCELRPGVLSAYALTSNMSDFTMQIVDGIDGSAGISNLVGYLSTISSDTALMSSVLSYLTTIDAKFADFYNLLAAYNATGSQNTAQLQYFDSIRVYLQRLQAALTGWSSNQATTPSALASLTFDRWVSIIETALNNQAPDVTEAAAQQQSAQQLSDTQHAQESAVFESAAGAMNDVDLNISIPGSIISAAVTLMSMVGLIWDRLGDFQFIAIVALSAGMIVVLLGVINRFQRRSRS